MALKSSELYGSDAELLLSLLFQVKGSVKQMYNSRNEDTEKSKEFLSSFKSAMLSIQQLIDTVLPDSESDMSYIDILDA